MSRTLLLATVLANFLAPCAKGESVLLCGADTVFLLEAADATKGKIEKRWTWNAKQCSQLPEAMRNTFRSTDDCKPVDGGTKILVSSSSGGCALVERPSGNVIWYAQVPNAHSLELLPRNRIVAASSVNAKGNRLMLFDVAHSDQPIWEAPLVSAHGAVWDETRKALWALGGKDLQSFELQNWEGDKPSLRRKASYPLPDEGGHDLQPVPRSNDLIVTSGGHVFLFDRNTHQFRLHPQLGDRANVKSVNVHPATGQTIFLQATESWWSDTLGLLDPPGKFQLPGERLYKARWLPK